MKSGLTLMLVALLVVASGCVERKMLIRSEPAGADVYINEEHVGNTGPDGELEVEFIFYGAREIRVGPIREIQRDEDGELINDPLQYHEMTRIVRVDAPWYQHMPIDFFAEVIWPFTITDVRTFDTFRLEPGTMEEEMTEEQRAAQAERLRKQGQDVLGRASLYREEALRPGAGLTP